jgi:hypothetical protein
MFGLSFQTSASGATTVTFMASCANAGPADAIKAPNSRSFFMSSPLFFQKFEQCAARSPRESLLA